MESAPSDMSYGDTFDEMDVFEETDVVHARIRLELGVIPAVMATHSAGLCGIMDTAIQWHLDLEDLTKRISCGDWPNQNSSLSDGEEISHHKQLCAKQASLHKEVKAFIEMSTSLQLQLKDLHEKIGAIKVLNEDCESLVCDIKLCRQESSEELPEDPEMNNTEDILISNAMEEGLGTSDSSEENEAIKDCITESIMDTTISEEIVIENDLTEDSKRINAIAIEDDWLKDSGEDPMGNSEDVSNPENWKKFKYSLPGGVFQAPELGYLIHSFGGTIEKGDFSLILANGNEFLKSLHGSYDVLSNVIRVEPSGLNESTKQNVLLRVSIPYVIMRNPHREIVIYCQDQTDEAYYELETQDTLYEESKEEGIKFAEALLPSYSCLCVVVSKRKVEKFEINKRSSVIESKVDDRISMLIPAGAVMVTTVVQLSVNSVDNSSLGELKIRLKTNLLDNIQTISPIVYITSDWERKLFKSAVLQIPIPFPHGHVASKNRIFSAAPSGPDKIDRRPKTALTHQIPKDPKSFVKLAWYNDKEKSWKINNDVQPTFNKNGDSLTVDLRRLDDQRIVAIRFDEDINAEKLQKALEIIEDSSDGRPIQFLLTQNTEDHNDVILIIGSPTKVERNQRMLKELEYNMDTMSVSLEYTVRERDWFTVKLLGNIMLDTARDITFPYNSQLPNRIKLRVREKDKFAQKSKDCFQGFVSIAKVGDNSEVEIWKSVINIPKCDQEIVKSRQKDFNFIPTDIISKEYLLFLSNEIGEDWRYLAYILKLPDECIRRIASNFRQDTKRMAFECLMKWIKNTTVYSNKVEIMERAFKKLGRHDLLKDLSCRSCSN